MSFINFHIDLKILPTKELKKHIKDRKNLNENTYIDIQQELLRRGEGYHH